MIRIEDEGLDSDPDEDPDEEKQAIHPLESHSLCFKIMHHLFHFWVFDLISKSSKKKSFSLDDIPQLPQQMTATYSYNKWMKVYNDRKSKNLSINTLSMVYHTEKKK
eukprot:234812_1